MQCRNRMTGLLPAPATAVPVASVADEVSSDCGRDVLDGELFLFVNRKRTGCKVLVWDGTGLCIFMKRLERGRFADLWGDGEDRTVRLSTSELALFIEGCTLIGKKSLSPAPITRNELAVADPV